MNNYAKKEFSIRLGKLRAEWNMSQQELSDRTGILRETIAKYETASRVPSLDDLAVLADHFHTTINYLLGLSDRKTLEIDLKDVQKYMGLSNKSISSIRGYCLGRLKSVELFYKQLEKEDPELLYHLKIDYEIYNWMFDSEDWNGVIFDFTSCLVDLKLNLIKVNDFCASNPKPDPDNNEEYRKWVDRYNELSNKVNMCKYRILKLTEELSNFFDERNKCK